MLNHLLDYQFEGVGLGILRLKDAGAELTKCKVEKVFVELLFKLAKDVLGAAIRRHYYLFIKLFLLSF